MELDFKLVPYASSTERHSFCLQRVGEARDFVFSDPRADTRKEGSEKMVETTRLGPISEVGGPTSDAGAWQDLSTKVTSARWMETFAALPIRKAQVVAAWPIHIAQRSTSCSALLPRKHLTCLQQAQSHQGLQGMLWDKLKKPIAKATKHQ